MSEIDIALLPLNLPPILKKNAPLLKWVHCNHAGVDGCYSQDLFDQNIKVSTASGRSNEALAEHVFFFMLSLAYHAPSFYQAQKNHQWGIPNFGMLPIL